MIPRVKLGQLLVPDRRPIGLGDGDETYPLIGVRWWGKGAFVREEKRGRDIKKKQHFIIRAGDIVFNKLFAWRGAFAIAGEDVDGCYGSDKFPTYRLRSDKVDPDYLRAIFTSKHLARQAEGMSVGSAAISKFTLNPPKFLELEIALPDLDQQRNLVALMQEIDAKLTTITDAQSRIVSEIPRLEGLVVERMSSPFRHRQLRELGKLERRSITIQDNVIYRQLTISMNNRGIRFRGEQQGLDIGVKNQAVAHAGDVVFSRIDIRNGAIGVVPPALDGCVVANDFPVYVFGERSFTRYADLAFKTPDFRQQSIGRSAGSTNRKKMRRDNFLELSLPVPPECEQQRIISTVEQVTSRTQDIASRISRLSEEAAVLRDLLFDQIAQYGALPRR